MISPPVVDFLSAAVKSGLSAVFSGAPGAGKTTILSYCAAEIDPSKRVVVAEEVFEADVPLANVGQTLCEWSGRPKIVRRSVLPVM